MNDELKALAERVEALTMPCRETDTEILWYTNRGNFTRGYWNAASGLPRELETMPRPNSGLGWIGAQCNAPVYTASLDAAMSLLSPEWGDWSISRDSIHKYEAAVWPARSRYTAIRSASVCHQGYHDESPALALTAAALRARAANLENSHDNA